MAGGYFPYIHAYLGVPLRALPHKQRQGPVVSTSPRLQIYQISRGEMKIHSYSIWSIPLPVFQSGSL